MDVIVGPVLGIVIAVIDMYMWVVIIAVILSWLTQFNVVNMSNRFVYLVADIVHRVTEPALGRIRRLLPNLGGLDLSPIALILALVFIKDILMRLAYKVA